MKILSVFCLFIGLSQCDQGHPNEKCWLSCDWHDYVGLVTFDDAGVAKCTKKDPTDGECDDAIIKDEIITNAATSGSLTWTDCLAIVFAYKNVMSDATHFRWEEKDTNGHPETYCYFLPACVGTAGHCNPIDGSPCVAGPSDDSCEEGEPAVCDPVVWKEEGLHWTCLSKSKEPVNPYTDTKLDEGTTCVSGDGTEGCSTWDWKPASEKLKVASVKCEADGWKSADSELVLNWSTEDATPVLPDDKDAECICGKFDLPLDIYDVNPGLSLICEKGVYEPTAEGIEYGNACAVLCDAHLTKYIECYRGNWMNTAQYPFVAVEPAEIGCSTTTTQ